MADKNLRKGWIEFAPLLIPWSRRLETLSAICFTLIWSTAFLGPILVYYMLMHTSYWYLAIAYISWIIYDRNTPKVGGRRRDYAHGLRIWKWYQNYFPIRQIKTSELDPSKNYFLGCHPHGIVVSGVQSQILKGGGNGEGLFPGMKINFVTLDLFFYIPIFRDLLLMAGGCSVSKGSINFLLSKKGGGNVVAIIPGGAREVIFSQPGTHILYLKKRKGFIKAAIENGVQLVPVYTFGETDLYFQPQNPEGSWIRLYQDCCLKWFGVPPIMFNGRGVFQYSIGILPRRMPITTIVGAPIPVKQMTNPTEEYINEVHSTYMAALTELFYAHRSKCGHVNAELTII